MEPCKSMAYLGNGGKEGEDGRERLKFRELFRVYVDCGGGRGLGRGTAVRWRFTPALRDGGLVAGTAPPGFTQGLFSLAPSGSMACRGLGEPSRGSCDPRSQKRDRGHPQDAGVIHAGPTGRRVCGGDGHPGFHPGAIFIGSLREHGVPRVGRAQPRVVRSPVSEARPGAPAVGG